MASAVNTRRLGEDQKMMLRYMRATMDRTARPYDPSHRRVIGSPSREREVLQSLVRRGLIVGASSWPGAFVLTPGGRLCLAELALEQHEQREEQARAGLRCVERRLQQARRRLEELEEEKQVLFADLARARDEFELQR